MDGPSLTFQSGFGTLTLRPVSGEVKEDGLETWMWEYVGGRWLGMQN
jgi:hypothetical protein